MTESASRPAHPTPTAGALRSLLPFAVVYASFVLVAFGVYRSAMTGPFLSDDFFLIVTNPYLSLPAADLLRESFAPTGDARQFSGGNYAPVQHLVHALEVRLFRGATPAYHLVNLLVHALNTTLLFALWMRAGLSRGVALLASTVFLLHPANVEAVAWISQLRSLLAMASGLGALLLLPRFPVLSTAVLALGLLAKTSASFVLPMAAVALWIRHRRGEPLRPVATGLALWLLVFLVYAPIQFSVFSSIARGFGEPYPDVATHARSILAIGARYLAMAATGYGVSAYHEPDPVHSSLDPWWLAGAVAALCLGARIAVTLRDARPEAGWWLSAIAGFAPVSQLFPFFFPMGDRYLYFILPGLIGGACLAGSDLADALARRAAGAAPWLARAARVGAVGLVVLFALHASGRAKLWQSDEALLLDSASQYPEGAIGRYVRAVVALDEGRRDESLALLRASAERGGALVRPFRGDKRLAALNGDPAFEALLRNVDQLEIDVLRARASRDQRDLFKIAHAHRRRGELELALAALAEGLDVGGPMNPDLFALQEQIRRERAGVPASTPSEPAAPASNPMLDFLR